jgi:uncharacterized alpha-E superfamily protein
MLSRVAENLYWFSRYLKRTENTARLVGVNSLLQLDLPRNVRFAWQPMLDILGADEAFAALHPDVGDAAGEADVVHFLLLDERNACSMLSSLKQARDALRTIREALPQESWERVNGTYLWLSESDAKNLVRRHRLDLLNRVVDDCLVVSGILTANVSRDIGFQFLRLGTALEQADMTTRIIDAGASGLIGGSVAEEFEAYQAMQWMSVLRSLAAYQMYRRHVRQRVSAAHALKFLLQDREFPRSVMFCLTRMQGALPQMPARRTVERALARAQALARDADTRVLAETGVAGLMDEIQIAIATLHQAITDAYFRA